jgi:sec-independent protein translocase protein TatB
MFGMGFFEIFFIAVIAILVLGPDKLPTATLEVVKFFRKIKNSIGEAKEVIDEELNVAELKDNMMEYKKSLDFTKSEIAKNLNIEDAKKEFLALDETLSDKKSSKDKTSKNKSSKDNKSTEKEKKKKKKNKTKKSSDV